jgi:hypothetical protein
MSKAGNAAVYDTIEVGEDLGSYSYVMTEEMIADYRRVVGNPNAAYPTVAARHPANLFYKRYGGRVRVPNTGQDSQYFNPPIAGKRIDVSAFIADKYERRNKRYLVIEARAVDEDGRPIETSRLIGMAGEAWQQALGAVANKWESQSK